MSAHEPTDTLEPVESNEHKLHGGTFVVTLTTLGVAFGDIGTSPLYAVRECFFGDHAITVTQSHVLGIVSLIVWSLLLIVSLKYLAIVFRADNQGEGGILALIALSMKDRAKNLPNEETSAVLLVGLVGAALLYGDGMITPAISVLSAIEGLNVVTPFFSPYVLPLTIAVLCVLFWIQRGGTETLGRIMGPVILIWFLTIGALGFVQLLEVPSVLAALNPWYGITFLLHNGWAGFALMGSVFLGVTGAESLYADMGHFGKFPIRLAWSTVAFPGLFLNYLGQGALLIENPEARVNPFYLLAPDFLQVPFVILATLATAIASQALISGAFSLTSQAIQLGYLPRMEIKHTSSKQIGQIYIPTINTILFVATILLVLGFQSSSKLASAYGLGLSLTMIITSVLVTAVMHDVWHWSKVKIACVMGPLVVLEAAFLVANALKFFHGGWFPFVIGAVAFGMMTTWRSGKRIVYDLLRARMVSFEDFLADISRKPPPRVPGTAVFLARDPQGVPPSLLHNVRHNKILHTQVVVLTIQTERVPYFPLNQRLTIDNLGNGIWRCVAHAGFMEKLEVMPILSLAEKSGLRIDRNDLTFFLSMETLLPADNDKGMALWREHLFALMQRVAQRAPAYFQLPYGQVVELGLQLEL